MTDTPHLRLVTDSPEDTASYAAQSAALFAQIDRLTAELTKLGAAAGPESLLDAHKKLGQVEAFVHQARANAAQTLHQFIQDNGALPPGGTVYRVLNIGGTVYKAKADSGSASMKATEAERMWAQFQAAVLAGWDPEAGSELVTARAQAGDDLATAIDACRHSAVAAALKAVEDCYGVTTGTGGKNARGGALRKMGITKDRYLTPGTGSTTLTFEPYRGALEAVLDDIAEASGQ